MCPGPVTPEEPTWRLQDSAGAWRLIISATSAPEIEIGTSSVRLVPKPGAVPVVLPIPEHALPVDADAAKVKFSRKRGELTVEWPRSQDSNVQAAVAVEEVASSSESAAAVEEVASSPEPAAAVEEVASSPEAAAAVEKEEEVPPVAEEQADADKEEQASDEPALSAEEWRVRGNALVNQDVLEAVRCYSAGIAVGGGDERIYSNRALCFHRLERYEEAVEDAQICVSLKPDFFKGYLRGAMALRALGKPEEALAFVKRCPRNDEAEKLVAEIRPEAQAAEAARIKSLQGAERPKAEGNVLFRKGLFEAALPKYTEALELCEDPEGSLALAIRNNRAACYHQISDYKAVVGDASFVLAREPCNLKALMRRMLALEPLESYEEALSDARAILRQDPRCDVANRIQHRLSKLVRDMDRAAGA